MEEITSRAYPDMPIRRKIPFVETNVLWVTRDYLSNRSEDKKLPDETYTSISKALPDRFPDQFSPVAVISVNKFRETPAFPRCAAQLYLSFEIAPHFASCIIPLSTRLIRSRISSAGELITNSGGRVAISRAASAYLYDSREKTCWDQYIICRGLDV